LSVAGEALLLGDEQERPEARQVEVIHGGDLDDSR
jgi:hypothetical protein